MLEAIFYVVLNMSITATIIGFAIVTLRFIKVLPRQPLYYLWGIILLRLMVPVSFPSEVSILNLIKSLVKKTLVVRQARNVHAELVMSNVIGAVKSYYPVVYNTALLEKIFKVSACVWGIGVISALLAVVIMYYIARNELNDVKVLAGNDYTCRKADVPMVLGIFKQRVIIPEVLKDDENLKYILMHENVHQHRYDNLIRLTAIFIACIHWFNPIIWIYLRLFLMDMETTCDLKAIRNLTKQERREYAKALLNLSCSQKVFAANTFSSSNTKRRVVNVINYKRMTLVSIAFSTMFIIIISLVLITNSMK